MTKVKCGAPGDIAENCRFRIGTISGSCTRRDKCMYQVEENVIESPEVVDGLHIFPFDCKCGHEWTQTSISPCSQILAVCGACGSETSYKVV